MCSHKSYNRLRYANTLFEQILTYQRKLSISLTFLSTLFVAQLKNIQKPAIKIYVQNWTHLLCMAYE